MENVILRKVVARYIGIMIDTRMVFAEDLAGAEACMADKVYEKG